MRGVLCWTGRLRGLELLNALVEDLHLVDVGDGGRGLRGSKSAGDGNRAGTVAGTTGTAGELSLAEGRVRLGWTTERQIKGHGLRAGKNACPISTSAQGKVGKVD